MTFPEIISYLLKCLLRPRLGVLHVPLVISGLESTRDLIEINLKKDNCLINCTPMGMSPLISISKSISVIFYYHIMHGFRNSTPFKRKSSYHFKDIHKLKLLTNFDVNLTSSPGGVMNQPFNS